VGGFITPGKKKTESGEDKTIAHRRGAGSKAVLQVKTGENHGKGENILEEKKGLTRARRAASSFLLL